MLNSAVYWVLNDIKLGHTDPMAVCQLFTNYSPTIYQLFTNYLVFTFVQVDIYLNFGEHLFANVHQQKGKC